jgi:tRNA pseudouridine55 synthase
MDGVLVVAKPVGPTSHDIVGLIRRLAATKRVGHGGTLDPFASGVLPVVLGKATRLVEYHLGDRKQYRATVCFGATSTTDDLEGALSPVAGEPPTRATVESALGRFRGTIEQRPPAYSAIKVAGRRAYAMARAGETVELASRSVTIDAIEIVSWDEATAGEPVAVIDLACSAGTYVRSLARDLGAAVGSGAYLGALIRTASGPFTLADATELEAVRAAAEAGPDTLAALLQPIDAGLELPTVVVPDAALGAIARGQAIGVPAGADVLPPDAPIRLVDGAGRLVAIARLTGTKLAPDKVLLDAPAAVGVGAVASPPA